MKDRYDCAQAGRVTVSSAFINQYGGASSSKIAVDGGLFMSCMGARGYMANFNGTGGFRAPPGTAIFLVN